jgi:asparagine synthase (glutamine-hydrolysing)
MASDALAGLEGRRILRKGFRDRLMFELLPAHPGYHGELVWILMMLERWLDADGRRLPHEPIASGDKGEVVPIA